MPQEFRRPDGSIVEVADAEVDRALLMGWEPSTPATQHVQYLQESRGERYGDGVLDTVAAGAAGLARGLTFGGSDVLLEQSGYGQERRGLEEFNPGASAAGEVVGTVLPALLPGGQVGLAAKGGAAAAKGTLRETTAVLRAAKDELSLAKRAGVGIESALSRTPAGIAARIETGIAGRFAPEGAGIVQRAAARTAGAGAYGATYGGTSYVNDVLSGDAEFSAEQFLSAVGENALYGGLIGGGIELVGPAVAGAKRAYSAAKERTIGRIFTKGATDDAMAQLRTGVRESLDDMNRATSETLMAGEINLVEMADDLIANAKDPKAVRKALLGGHMGGGLKDSLKQLAPARNDFMLHLNRVRAEMPEELVRVGKMSDDRVASVTDAMHPSAFDEDDVTAFVNAVHGKDGQFTAAARKYSTVLNNVDRDLTKVYEAAGRTELPPGLLSIQRSIGEVMGKVPAGGIESLLRDVSADRIRKIGVQATLGYVFGVSDFGDLLPGPLGEVVGAIAGAKAIGGVASMVSARNPMLKFVSVIERRTAEADSKVGRLLGAAEGRAKHAPRAALVPTIDSIAGAIEPTLPEGFRPEPARGPDRIVALRSAMQRAASNPAALREAVERSMGQLNVAQPAMVEAVAGVVQRKAEFILSKLPVDPRSDEQRAVGAVWRPDARQLDELARYVRAVADPLSVIDDAIEGRLTPQAVEAVREVYPQTYERIRASVLDEAARLGTRLPYGTRVQLSVMFDGELDPTVGASYVSGMQESAARFGGGKPTEARPWIGTQRGSLSDLHQTDQQRASGR